MKMIVAFALSSLCCIGSYVWCSSKEGYIAEEQIALIIKEKLVDINTRSWSQVILSYTASPFVTAAKLGIVGLGTVIVCTYVFKLKTPRDLDKMKQQYKEEQEQVLQKEKKVVQQDEKEFKQVIKKTKSDVTSVRNAQERYFKGRIDCYKRLLANVDFLNQQLSQQGYLLNQCVENVKEAKNILNSSHEELLSLNKLADDAEKSMQECIAIAQSDAKQLSSTDATAGADDLD